MAESQHMLTPEASVTCLVLVLVLAGPAVSTPDPDSGCYRVCENCGTPIYTDHCTCLCPPGYYGPVCSEFCEDDPVICAGVTKEACVDPRYGTVYRTACPEACGYCTACTGHLCPDPCPTCLPCDNCGVLNKRTCECQCPQGYWGPTCSDLCEDIDASQCRQLLEANITCTTEGYVEAMKSSCAATCGYCKPCNGSCIPSCPSTTKPPKTTTTSLKTTTTTTSTRPTRQPQCSIDGCYNSGTFIEEECRCRCTSEYTGHMCQAKASRRAMTVGLAVMGAFLGLVAVAAIVVSIYWVFKHRRGSSGDPPVTDQTEIMDHVVYSPGSGEFLSYANTGAEYM